MKERPILFSAPMVRAILDGTKTQTRRIISPRPQVAWQLKSCGILTCEAHSLHAEQVAIFDRLDGLNQPYKFPYGQLGDQLWVRETWRWADAGECGSSEYDVNAASGYEYRADGCGDEETKWKPSIHMPRLASRIQLEITGIRVERLQDISEDEAIAEGVFKKVEDGYGLGDIVETIDGGEAIYLSRGQARFEYRHLWESINGAGSWDANPWVWVIEFRRIKP